MDATFKRYSSTWCKHDMALIVDTIERKKETAENTSFVLHSNHSRL